MKISVIGNIGAGKTYFINNILNDIDRVYEPLNEISKILSNENMFFVEKQSKIHELMYIRDESLNENVNCNYILERDYITSTVIFNDNRNIEYYRNKRKLFSDIYIYLMINPERCLSNIINRNNAYENSITLDELSIYHSRHIFLLTLFEKLEIDYIVLTDNNERNLNNILYTKYTSKIIYIEGSISVGKTTVGKMLRSLGYTYLEEPIEEYKEYLEAQTNKDNTKAYLFQLNLMFDKIKQIDKAIKSFRHKGNIIFIERSIESGIDIFSNINLSEEKLHDIFSIYNKCKIGYPNKSIIVYMFSDINISIARSKTREIESRYERKYYEDVIKAYEEFIEFKRNEGIDIIKIENNAVCSIDLVDDILKRIKYLIQ